MCRRLDRRIGPRETIDPHAWVDARKFLAALTLRALRFRPVRVFCFFVRLPPKNMFPDRLSTLFQTSRDWVMDRLRLQTVPAVPVTIALAGVVGVLGGYGAVLFTFLIEFITRWTIAPIVDRGMEPGQGMWFGALCIVPALGLLAVSWFTRRFAPEAQGHGVPEVITAMARHDGVIRGRVSFVKILASGVCIGTGGSIGREGPIIQIGSALGSTAGQWFGLSPRYIKVLVAAGAAAGISATFNAPLAGVMFACEIILGSFAVESLAPIVVASVLASVVQAHATGIPSHGGEPSLTPAFPEVYHTYHGAWSELPSYFVLGLLAGLAAVGFTKLLYGVEDFAGRWLPSWWARALVFGSLVGIAGMAYPMFAPISSLSAQKEIDEKQWPVPPLMGVGYGVVGHALHLETASNEPSEPTGANGHRPTDVGHEKLVHLTTPAEMIAEFWWLLPLAFLKPLLTSLTLGGGGSGGIFAPSLFLGATLGAAFGLVCNMLVPGASANPGVYAIVGMGAVVAGTTHGTLSAILIVYEMTNDYTIILPIMVAAGLAGVVARFIDPESIYLKKLSRRGESVARGHDMHHLEHIMVRNVMIRKFPTARQTDNVTEIIRLARAHPDVESLPVMNEEGELVGIIRPVDLHRVIDSDLLPHMLNADDIAWTSPRTVAADATLLEALRDFGAADVETLPVVSGRGKSQRLVGMLQRSDVMRRYRRELLRRR